MPQWRQNTCSRCSWLARPQRLLLSRIKKAQESLELIFILGSWPNTKREVRWVSYDGNFKAWYTVKLAHHGSDSVALPRSSVGERRGHILASDWSKVRTVIRKATLIANDGVFRLRYGDGDEESTASDRSATIISNNRQSFLRGCDRDRVLIMTLHCMYCPQMQWRKNQSGQNWVNWVKEWEGWTSDPKKLGKSEERDPQSTDLLQLRTLTSRLMNGRVIGQGRVF